MKKVVKIKKLKIGEGIPKICTPIVNTNIGEILNMAKKIKEAGADLVEWRADYFEDIKRWQEVEDTLKELKSILGNTPLLFTLRTLNDGGNLKISSEEYFKLNSNIIRTKLVDIIDVELSSGHKIVKGLIADAKKFNVYTIISNHDFEKTPDKNEIIKIMCEMQSLNGDILKIAVMPKNKRDVLVLLDATEEMTRVYADRPIVTISMSSLGVVSRLTGEIFGSDITFGSVGEESAPGQLPIEELKELLKIFHKEISLKIPSEK